MTFGNHLASRTDNIECKRNVLLTSSISERTYYFANELKISQSGQVPIKNAHDEESLYSLKLSHIQLNFARPYRIMCVSESILT